MIFSNQKNKGQKNAYIFCPCIILKLKCDLDNQRIVTTKLQRIYGNKEWELSVRTALIRF
mgnify:CR=1 FL=1